MLNGKKDMFKISLDERQLCDLEMLLNGGFSPLKGFLTEGDYNSVLSNMRLLDGSLWPIPIVLRLEKKKYNHLLLTTHANSEQEKIELLDSNNEPVASITVSDIYEIDRTKLNHEFTQIYGCTDNSHDYISYVQKKFDEGNGLIYIGGQVTQLNNGIIHYSFNEHRLTPTETRKFFKDNNWNIVVGFQTRNPMHKSHFELTKYAMKEVSQLENVNETNVRLLLHPVIGITQECDVPYEVRVRCYKKLLKYYPEGSVNLSLLPLSMRMAGPREALWHALIRQNYGCTHFIVGRDHAGPSSKRYDGESFFGPYDSHKLLEGHANELKIKIVKSRLLGYVPSLNSYLPDPNDTETVSASSISETASASLEFVQLSGTKLRNILKTGGEIPEWFTFPEISKELQDYYPPTHKQGFCLYFVGLSGCGKTTMSKAVIEKLNEIVNDRKITMLDGDIVREHLGQLGFSKEDRSLNVRRIGYMAQTIVKNGGICVCANIAPYREDRLYNRKNIPNYIEIYLSTPIDVCEKRDVKGLYKKARDGTLKHFTGIDDPFEEPLSGDSDITLSCDDSKLINPHIETILKKLYEHNLLKN
jgi:sulfate adenylyltransferase